MKKGITLFIAGVIMVASLSAYKSWVHYSEAAGTNEPQINIPNPASVYCEQNGNKLEIRTAVDGSQNGVCIFPDGSSCDEWAYFRGECVPNMKPTSDPAAMVDPTVSNASGGDMPSGASEPFSDWWRVIKSTPTGAKFDVYFERQDLGQTFINFGIDSLDPALKSQIEVLCDSGKIVHL